MELYPYSEHERVHNDAAQCLVGSNPHVGILYIICICTCSLYKEKSDCTLNKLCIILLPTIYHCCSFHVKKSSVSVTPPKVLSCMIQDNTYSSSWLTVASSLYLELDGSPHISWAIITFLKFFPEGQYWYVQPPLVKCMILMLLLCKMQEYSNILCEWWTVCIIQWYWYHNCRRAISFLQLCNGYLVVGKYELLQFIGLAAIPPLDSAMHHTLLLCNIMEVTDRVLSVSVISTHLVIDIVFIFADVWEQKFVKCEGWQPCLCS